MKYLISLFILLNSLVLLASNNSLSTLSITTSQTDLTCNGVCSGEISISASGGTTPYQYSIDNGSTFSTSNTFNNLCAGTYSIVVTDNLGAQATSSVTLSEPNPLSLTLSATNPSCNGTCDGMINSIPYGGTSPYTYSWSNGSGNSPFGTNLCEGTYTLTVTDGNNCTIDTSINIVGPPAINVQTSSDTIICIGGTASLSAQASGGSGYFAYQWDNGDNSQNISVSPTSQQTYCVTATDGNGCSSGPSCVVVNLYQPLAVMAFSDQAICAGLSVNISVVGSGGIGSPYTYTWDQGIGLGSYQTVTPTQTTVYTVSITDQCETPAATASVTITVNPSPTADFTYSGEPTVNFTNQSVDAVTYLWSFDSNAASNSSNPSYVFGTNGNHTVCLKAISSFGCVDSICKIVTIDNVSVEEQTKEKFSLYPNPITNGQLTIKSSSSENLSIKILNVLGQQVWKGTTNNGKTIDVSNLEKGNYLARISSSESFYTEKIIIE